MEELTKKQKMVLRHIIKCIKRTGWAPTRREIATYYGWAGPGSAQHHINALAEKGYLRVGPGARQLKILASPEGSS